MGGNMNWLMLLALCVVVPAALAGNYPETTVDMPLHRVSEHVYYVQGKAGVATDNEGFISNAAAIVSDAGVVVVDALGSPSLAQRFLEQLRTVTDQPVTQVIVTHYHADHVYGLQLFKDLGAEIIAPAGFRDYLDSEAAANRLEERRVSLYPWVNADTRLIGPDRVISQDTTLSIGGLTLQLAYLGAAHSDGDLSVLVQPDRVLISGDIIFEGRVPFTGGADTRHWLEVLEHLDDAGLKALVPGHGPAAEDPREAVRLTLDYLRYTREVMAAAVEEMVPFAEAYDAADWSRFEKLPAFEAAHRRNAYGVYLSLEQESLAQ
jgi:glyoxylase-like metal-dependent hydrolase (beta-lactamase superfamily II)